ncbi:ataxin-3 isoform X7 [Ornithorhynchus anatinus]|uniref:ataxin-3 isoform X7 n=1 Tax=Ornithorhynchus anatinus TaxID=9258 RepID=UPI0010A85A36|nr:ataxin-3 isoform X7 [Ornithorhynchus anatinus]
MEAIFHEKQEGSLCAQHCLNNLLQGEYFSPVELSSIAHQLDEEERMRMAEGGLTSEDYRTFLQQPSGNMDDSGFFSIQGDLPDCEADQLLQMIRVQQIQRPKLIGEELAQSKDQSIQKTDLEQALEVSQPYDGTGMVDEDEENLQKALALSRQEIDMEDEEADLRRAIQLSMQGSHRNASQDRPQTSSSKPSSSLTSEELRKRREAYFEKQQQQLHQQEQITHVHDKPSSSSDALRIDPGEGMTEEDMLQAAMNMSLETVSNNLKSEEKK